jgi:hypothetical protein
MTVTVQWTSRSRTFPVTRDDQRKIAAEKKEEEENVKEVSRK